jgi:hypothetical protein
MKYLASGFILGHPFCGSFEFLSPCLTNFPNNISMLGFIIKMAIIFPSHHHKLHNFYEFISNFDSSNFKLKFLLNQLKMVMTQRAISESLETTSYCNDLSILLKRCETDIKEFFESIIQGENSQQLIHLSRISSDIIRTKHVFEDLQVVYPLNQIFLKLKTIFFL